MSFHVSRALQIRDILKSYRYPTPFPIHLKNWFRDHRNAGSKDRKELRSLAYAWIRAGRLFKDVPFEKALEKALETIQKPDLVKTFPDVRPDKIFPFLDYVSEEFRDEEFCYSHLRQPYVWLHLKKGLEGRVKSELTENKIRFEKVNENCLRLQPDMPLEKLEGMQRGWAWVQDISSQSTAVYFKPQPNENWWDACSGSGGKALCLMEQQPTTKLWATDTRKEILENLKNRFRLHDFKLEKAIVADLTDPAVKLKPGFAYDGIIADVPCTGSGTWARNPENLLYFNPDTVEGFHQRQLSILQHVFPYLKSGKPLIYITCSVFRRENEEVIHGFLKNNKAEVETQLYFKGYKEGAENLFLCRMIKT